MTNILCNYNDATAKCLDMFTSGMVGPEISFEFSEDWDGLTKTAVFSAGDVQRDVLIGASNVITIPWEVLQHAKEQLMVGVYGTNGTELVIPTVYAGLGRIRIGADPSGDPGIPPTPSILDQVLTAAEQTLENAEAVQAAKESVDASEAHIDEIAERVIEEAGAVAESVAEAERAAAEAQRMAAEASRVASEALEIENDVLAARDRAEAAADSSEAVLEEITDIQTGLQAEIDSINEKIPEQASAENQLADKDFVNSSVATNTANYISNENNEPFASLAELQAYSGPLTNNDYAFVVGTDAQGNVTYTRYKWVASQNQWAEEYVLNNSSFTAAQWAAINSGITALAVEQIETNRAAISDILTTLALKANDADVYHEHKYGYNATAQAITMNGTSISFADAYAAIEDRSKFVYVEYSNRVYIPQYVSSGLIYFVAAFIDSGMIKVERIMFNAATGKALTASLSAYDTVKIDTLLATQYSPDNPPPYPVTSVNGQTGAVVIPAAPIDATLTHAGEAADAKAVGDRLTAIETGEHFAEFIDDSAAYIKAVPTKSLRTALLNSFGAASMRWNQYSPNDAVSEAAGGLTFTKNADLSVTVTGTASANTSHYISDGNSAAIPAGHTVFLFGCPAGGGSSRYRLRTRINGDWGSAAQTDYGSGVIFTTQEESTFRLGIYVNSGIVANDIVFRPCLVDLTAISLGDITDPSDPALDPVRSYALTHLAPSSGAAVYFAPAMVVSRDSGGNTVAVYPTEGIVDEFFPLGMRASGAVYDEVDLAGAQVIQRIGSDGEPLDSPVITPMTEPILRDIEVAAGGTLTFANDQFTAIALPSSVTFVTYQGGAVHV